MSLFGDDVIFDDDLDDDNEIDQQDEDIVSFQNEKLLPAKSNPFCTGHEAQEKLFLDLFEKNSMPHAMIFSGPEGIGKSTTAFRLARFLLKHGGENEEQDSLFSGADIQLKHTSLDVPASDPVFTRIASSGHVDFRYIERSFDQEKGKKDSGLKVEALRQIEPFLRMKASNGGWRVVIIEDADTMNRNAQNALLKILEEPPPKVLMILVVHRAGALIPTIRSRARMINFLPLGPEIMKNLIMAQGLHLSEISLQRLQAIANGSIGRALGIAEEGGLEMLDTILDQLQTLKHPNWVKIHELANELGPAAQEKQYRLFTTLMEWLFRQLLFIKARGSNDLPPYLQHEALQGFLKTSSLEKLIQTCDDLKNLYAKTDFSNLDRRDAVRGSFLVISQ